MESRTVITGLITSIFSIFTAVSTYYIVTDAPVDPTKNIKITETRTTLSTKTLLDAAYVLTSSQERPDNPAINHNSDKEPIDFIGYNIRNNTDYSIKGVEFYFDPVIFGRIFKKNSEEKIDSSQDSIRFDLEPNEFIFVSLVSSEAFRDKMSDLPVNFFFNSSFSVNGKGIEVDSLDPTKHRKVSDIIIGLMYALGFFIFSLIVLDILAIIIIPLLFLLSRRYPLVAASKITTLSLGFHLATINFIKDTNQRRYKKIVASAERFYDKWN